MSRLMTKPTKLHVRPAYSQISLGIRSVWSESLLSAWKNMVSSATHWAHCKVSDQAGPTDHSVGFVMRWLIWLYNVWPDLSVWKFRIIWWKTMIILKFHRYHIIEYRVFIYWSQSSFNVFMQTLKLWRKIIQINLVRPNSNLTQSCIHARTHINSTCFSTAYISGGIIWLPDGPN